MRIECALAYPAWKQGRHRVRIGMARKTASESIWLVYRIY